MKSYLTHHRSLQAGTLETLPKTFETTNLLGSQVEKPKGVQNVCQLKLAQLQSTHQFQCLTSARFQIVELAFFFR